MLLIYIYIVSLMKWIGQNNSSNLGSREIQMSETLEESRRLHRRERKRNNYNLDHKRETSGWTWEMTWKRRLNCQDWSMVNDQ